LILEARSFAKWRTPGKYQACTFDSALVALDWACAAMAITSCSISDMRFQFDHISAIFEPSMRLMDVPVTLAFLLVGGIPSFDNLHSATSRTLAIVSPGILSPDYFREIAAVAKAAAGGPPDPKSLAEVMRRHGLTPAP
jgi:hypothetical protein